MHITKIRTIGYLYSNIFAKDGGSTIVRTPDDYLLNGTLGQGLDSFTYISDVVVVLVKK